MNNTRGRWLVQLATSSSQHPSQQRLNEATGQLYEDKTMQQCNTSSEDVLFDEGLSSDSDYLPEESNVGFQSNALEESRSSNAEVLDDETAVLTRKVTHKMKRNRKGQADQTKWKRLKNSKARLQGKQYKGFEKDRNGKYGQILLRPDKCLQARCGGHTEVKHGGPRQRFECEMLTEEE
ncbi:unnamed protein product [Parnassius apollo]|uniref:(apollo) hypothetical protein n=1 Tax=Parnassius apollo TaxID=110799 RepID=A0A8S3WBI3_PARAO|nr:unnamed protein product [Parnassius apollo]